MYQLISYISICWYHLFDTGLVHYGSNFKTLIETVNFLDSNKLIQKQIKRFGILKKYSKCSRRHG